MKIWKNSKHDSQKIVCTNIINTAKGVTWYNGIRPPSLKKGARGRFSQAKEQRPHFKMAMDLPKRKKCSGGLWSQLFMGLSSVDDLTNWVDVELS